MPDVPIDLPARPQMAMAEISADAPMALQAVKLLAKFMSSDSSKVTARAPQPAIPRLSHAGAPRIRHHQPSRAGAGCESPITPLL